MGNQPAPIRTEDDSTDVTLVAAKDEGPGSAIPTAGSEPAPVGAEGDGLDIILVAAENEGFDSRVGPS
jgi:hypothetical protein